MAERRNGIDHAKRDTLSDEPVVRRRRRSPPPRSDRVLDQREALIEAVAAVFDIVAFLAPVEIIGSPGCTMLRSRNTIGSMPSLRASSSIADSTAKLVCGRP
jgi:hypothetical protein